MSIYWVKDTVAADTIGTVDTFADPYGIQKAFDLATAGDEIRIVLGADNYNSASTSWTNRDAADKTINVDTNAGTDGNPIKVSGWLDETTEGQATLDFDSASIVGSHGFAVTATVDYVTWKNIRVTDCDSNGWDLASGAVGHQFLDCQGDNCGGRGLNHASIASFTRCRWHTNSGSGADGSPQAAIFCESHGNTLDGWEDGTSAAQFAFCIADDNGRFGIKASRDGYLLVCVLCEDNSSDGLYVSSQRAVLINSGFTNNGDYGVDGAAGAEVRIELACGYYGNVTGTVNTTNVALQQSIDRVTTDPTFTDAANRDYSISTNWKAQGEGGFPSGASAGYVDIGAVQRQEVAGGGGGLLIHPGMSGGMRA